MDEFLSNKVDLVSNTTTKVTSNLKSTYDTQMKLFAQAKEFTIATYNRVLLMTSMVLTYLNTFLETPFVKKVSEPVLNLVETSVSRFLSIEGISSIHLNFFI